MTREIPLSNGYVALVDDDDFARLIRHRWTARGSASKGRYACRRCDGRDIWMHKEIIDAPAGMPVDHINRDTLDNRRANLRVCSPAENMRNRATARTKRGEYRGVHQKRPHERWKASIMVDRVAYQLGHFRTALEAALAYDAAAIKHHGEFASLNFDRKRNWIFPVGKAAWPPESRA